MIVETFSRSSEGEWNINAFPDLDSPNTLVLVFGGRELRNDPAPLSQLANAYPQALKAGCSTSGEILDATIGDESLVVAVVKFERTQLHAASARLDEMSESASTGRALGDRLDNPDLSGILVLAKGLEINGSALARGMDDVVSNEVVITGGLAGDGDRFERTWVFDGDNIEDRLVRAIGFYGDDIEISHGAEGGWTPFGPTRVVSRSEENVLHELDGEPALDIYKDYLGDQAENLPASALRFPLSVVPPNTPNEEVVRTVLGVDEDEQSMTFAGEIPQGSDARFMKTTIDQLVEGAQESAELSQMTAKHSETGDVLAVGISCVGRRLVLKEMADRELEAVLGELPSSTHLIGFYSYGELSPSVPGKPCSLHNQTMTLTVLSERGG